MSDNILLDSIAGYSKCKYYNGLYIVGTPIGNLEDITLRAINVLQKSDLILCEDTRVTNKLLNHYGIKKTLAVYNDHSTDNTRKNIVNHLRQDKIISLVSDAGMPLISDPGYKLINKLRQEEIYITCIPGCSAFITALVLSNLPTDNFTFMGFMPKKVSEVKKTIENLPNNSTIIFYESPARLIKTIDILENYEKISSISIAKELTKKFEYVITCHPKEIKKEIANIKLCGEVVLLIRIKGKKVLIDIDNFIEQEILRTTHFF